MNFEAITAQLKNRFGREILAEVTAALDPWIEVTPESVPGICLYLRDDDALRMDTLNCITAVDYPAPIGDQDKSTFEPHIMLVYHLSSIAASHRFVMKVRLPRWLDGVEGRLPESPSVMSVWSTADWHEREVYDLCGIRFTGRDGLHRILLPEDWDGHPLRKDYEPPSEYHGISNQ